jgi:FMN reductase
MSDSPLNVLAVTGSLNRNSVTRIVVAQASEQLRAAGCQVDVLDLIAEPIALFDPDTAYSGPGYRQLKERVDRADVLLLGTPDYHGGVSGCLKNFLDHFWREFAGKLFATIVSSHEKGLTVTDQLRTVARQCYAWALPYGLSFSERELVDGRIASEPFQKRLDMMVRDIAVYGRLLAQQRRADLAGADPGFMAKHRSRRSP